MLMIIIIVTLHYFNGPASFSVECESTWGPTGKTTTTKKTSGGAVCTSPVPSTPGQFVFTKMYFVHEQVSDMQTSTLSRNKYTRSQKRVSGGLTAFDKHDTNTLIEDIQKHSTVWWFCLSPAIRTYRHYWPRSLFFKRSIRNQSCCWLTQIFPGVHIFPPSSLRRFVEVCWSLLAVKDSSTERPAASIQHSLPEKHTKTKRHTEALQ